MHCIDGAIVDITERKRAEAAEREYRSLKQAVAAMEQVIGVIGHELRTPLTGLRAMTELLLTDDTRLSSEQTGFMRSIHEEIIRMSDMVNNMLEAARINSGMAKWSWSTFEVAPVCLAAVEVVRPLVNAAQVHLTCDVPPDLVMTGDADAIRRLVVNLLNNAQKHTAQGVIGVAVSEQFDSEGRFVEIEVSDTGDGISEEVASKVGAAFALNHGVIGASYVRGSGLGLAICRGIVAAHGGRMAIESSSDAGTAVRAILRADLPEARELSEIRIMREVAA